MKMSDEKKYLIKRLTNLLKENGPSILTDGVPLCLTVSFLHFLNGGFSVLVDDDFGASFEALPGSSIQVPICQDLQFLYDFIQKTPKLKLIYDTAFSGEATSIAAFRSLLELELKRVPVSMVTGLSKLRRKLKVLVCSRCLQHLEDVLEHHEAESSLMWTQLTKLCCSYNFITELDNSLRLLPVVAELDLSHNNIYDTDSYLEHLTELQSLDLGFNLLSVVPSLSISTQNKLKKLCLRHNQLENIEGLQELHNLTDLDLGYNCLSLHRLLWPLRQLEKLQLLILEGNPLSYHSKHRLLTVEQLHPGVIKQLVLDRRKLTAQESLVVQHNSLVLPSSPAPRHQPAGITRECTSLPASDFVDSLDESTNCSASSLPSPRRSVKVQRKKKKQRKPRTVEITDASDTTAEKNTKGVTAAAPESCPAENSNVRERIDAKNEIEVIRKQLGPGWLQTLTAAQELTNPSEPVNEATNQIRAEEPSTVNPASALVEQNGNRSGSQSGCESCQCEVTDPEPDQLADAEADGVDGAAIMTLESLNVMAEVVDDVQGSPAKTDDCHPDNVFSWSKVEPADVDYGLESDPFIVRHPEGGSTDHFLVTVAERYILEKDIEGNLMEALDQRCLKRVELVAGDEAARVVHCRSDDLSLVRLSLDYYKRDKTERCYVMEDLKSAESLVELLEPAVELHNMSEALRDLLQCLKCNTQFSQSEIKKKFAASETELFPGDGRQCPKCKSDLIIELDMGQISRSVGQRGTMTFDLQSEGPGGMPYQPTLHSTPVKSQDCNRLVYNESSHGSIHFSSVQLDSPLRTMVRNASSVSLDSKVTGRSAEQVSSGAALSARSQEVGTNRTAHRQVSESSDIIVLDEKRQSNDIAVLTGPCDPASSAPMLSPIRDSPLEAPPGGQRQGQGQSTEATPYGSLSENTIHSMVSSVYENMMTDVQDSRPFFTICDDSDASAICRDDDKQPGDPSFQTIEEPDVTKSSVGGMTPEGCGHSVTSVIDADFDADHIRFSFTDYGLTDHRLKLYLSLEVIGADEELCLLLQCGVVSLDEPVECSGVVVITNTKLYILYTELPLSAERLSKGLKLKHCVELSQLERMVQGLGAMCLYVVWEKVGYRLLIRDEKQCEDFIDAFIDHLQTLSSPPKFDLEAIHTEQITAKNAIAEVLSVSDTDTDTDICLHVMCHQQVGALEAGEGAMSAVSLFVSAGHVAMVTEDQRYVLEELAGDWLRSVKHRSTSQTRKQFEVKDLQKLTDIVTIEIQSSNRRAVSLTFSEEGSPDEYTWHLVMATLDTRQRLVAVVTRLWEEQFGVELICRYV